MVFGWQKNGEMTQQEFVDSLLARKTELELEATDGVTEPTARANWIAEWGVLMQTILISEDVHLANLAPDAGMGSPALALPDTTSENPSSSGTSAVMCKQAAIFVVGGRVGTMEPVSYVERFDALRNIWVRVASLNHARSGVTLAAFGGASQSHIT